MDAWRLVKAALDRIVSHNTETAERLRQMETL
jgi:hypothetical protein